MIQLLRDRNQKYRNLEKEIKLSQFVTVMDWDIQLKKLLQTLRNFSKVARYRITRYQ